jgi:hypothetical protein
VRVDALRVAADADLGVATDLGRQLFGGERAVEVEACERVRLLEQVHGRGGRGAGVRRTDREREPALVILADEQVRRVHRGRVGHELQRIRRLRRRLEGEHGGAEIAGVGRADVVVRRRHGHARDAGGSSTAAINPYALDSAAPLSPMQHESPGMRPYPLVTHLLPVALAVKAARRQRASASNELCEVTSMVPTVAPLSSMALTRIALLTPPALGMIATSSERQPCVSLVMVPSGSRTAKTRKLPAESNPPSVLPADGLRGVGHPTRSYLRRRVGICVATCEPRRHGE